MLAEIEKLEAARAVDLPDGLFSGVTPRVLEGWRQRASFESPSHLREHSTALRVTLLSALLHAREREITDTLVDLLKVAGVNDRVEVDWPRRGPRGREGCREMPERPPSPPPASRPVRASPGTRRRQPDQDEIATRAYFMYLAEGGGDQLAKLAARRSAS